MPVVDVEHVERRAVAPERREGRPAEDGEAPRIVRVVVVAVAVERSRHVDEAEAVAVRRDVHDAGADGLTAGGVRDSQRRLGAQRAAGTGTPR